MRVLFNSPSPFLMFFLNSFFQPQHCLPPHFTSPVFHSLFFFTLSFLTTHSLVSHPPSPYSLPPRYFLSLWPQQQQLQHLSHHAPGIPLTPHPSGLSLGAGGSGLLALTGALGVSAHLASKDERNHLDPEHLRGKEAFILFVLSFDCKIRIMCFGRVFVMRIFWVSS